MFVGYSRGISNYPKRITLSDLTHMMSKVDLIAIGVETLSIDSECSLDKEFTKLIRVNLGMVIISNCQSSWFMSLFCMWSFDLRHQRHLMDKWSCFDYDLRLLSHVISKTSYIGYDMKSTKMIVWLRCDHLPLVFEEIDSMNEMRWNPWPRQWKYRRSSRWFHTRISTNFSDRLGFNSWPYPKSFMSLMRMKDIYTW